MALEITEDWIKDRIKLDHENLDDVKSLALPGTYHEKISRLGFSLLNFTRLQHLDLSKNSLVTLKGLDHLSLLENLNLYYNKIEDLKEIFRLRKNSNLRDVDLRLNPVTANEPDYRLFIAHMLPLLRRLDDRPVRDSERKAAFLHFSATQMPDMLTGDESAYVAESDQPLGNKGLSRQPRVNYVKNMVQKPTVVDPEDRVDDVIDYVTTGMGKTSQAADVPKEVVQMHTKEDLVKIVRKETDAEERKKRLDTERRVQFLSDEEDHLQYKDEDSAYTQYRGAAVFTPHPGNTDPPPTVNQTRQASTVMSQSPSTMSEASCDEYKGLPEGKLLSFGDSTTSQEVSRRKNLTQIKFIECLLNLVDRYWNGTKSLHYHQKFQALAQKPLDCYEHELTSAKDVQIKVLQDKVATQQQEVKNLHRQLHDTSKQASTRNQTELTSAQKDLESLKTRHNLTMSDNKILRNKVAQFEEQQRKSNVKPTEGKRVVELEQENKELEQQVAALRRNVGQFEKLSQLTEMLQDSHRSLVATNEHLLNELEDARRRHQSEVEQLKWSYDKLRSASRLANGHASLNGEL